MAVSPTSSSSLELTISVPGFSSSPSLPSSGNHQGVCAVVVRDFDINQLPSEAAEEEWIAAAMDDEEESTINGGTPPRKKLRLSKEQSRLLEESFRQHYTLNPRQKEALALQLRLTTRQVEVWFQNRRARSKLKQTEMECEYLKRWFSSLTEQNRRLQREVEELRAMKVGPPTVISPHNCEPLPASTLTMCPRCERVTTSAAAAAATTHGNVKISAAAVTAVTTTISLSSNVATASLQSRQPSAAC